jgi:hypothetical protein
MAWQSSGPPWVVSITPNETTPALEVVPPEFVAETVIETTVTATATPMWLPLPAGRTRVQVSPTTASQGVRITAGRPFAPTNDDDPTVLAPASRVLAVGNGFWLRRSGAADCTVTLRLGA